MSDSDPTGLSLFLTPDPPPAEHLNTAGQCIYSDPLWGEPKPGPLGPDLYYYLDTTQSKTLLDAHFRPMIVISTFPVPSGYIDCRIFVIS